MVLGHVRDLLNRAYKMLQLSITGRDLQRLAVRRPSPPSKGLQEDMAPRRRITTEKDCPTAAPAARTQPALRTNRTADMSQAAWDKQGQSPADAHRTSLLRNLTLCSQEEGPHALLTYPSSPAFTSVSISRPACLQVLSSSFRPSSFTLAWPQCFLRPRLRLAQP